MNRVLALIAMIACTQAITVHLESQTESEDVFDGIADSIRSAGRFASEAIDNAANDISLPPRDPWHNHPCQGF